MGWVERGLTGRHPAHGRAGLVHGGEVAGVGVHVGRAAPDQQQSYK